METASFIECADWVPYAEVARRAIEAIGCLEDHVIFHHIFGYPVGLAHPPHWMDGAPFHITTDNPEPMANAASIYVRAVEDIRRRKLSAK